MYGRPPASGPTCKNLCCGCSRSCPPASSPQALLDVLRALLARHPHIRIIDCRAGIYFIREQAELPVRIPRRTAPIGHLDYNILILYRGPSW